MKSWPRERNMFLKRISHIFLTLQINIFSTVGGLSSSSIKTACEKLYGGQKQNEDTPCSLSHHIQTKPSHAASQPSMYWLSPWRTTAVDEDSNDCSEGVSELEACYLTGEWDSEPKSLRDDYITDEKDGESKSDSEVDIYMGEEEFIQEKWLKNDRDYEGDWEEEGDEDDEEAWDSSESSEYLCALQGLFPLLQDSRQTNDGSWGSDAELEYLRDGESLKTQQQ